MNINVVNQSEEKKWNRYKALFVEISERACDVLKLTGDRTMSVIFVDKEQIHEINRDYRGIDRPTDVISFALKDNDDDYDMVEGEDELGDIFINIEAVYNQAKEYGHTLKREVCFLFTHGMLHLLGYDHMEEDDEKVMFALQDEILDEIVPKRSRK